MNPDRRKAAAARLSVLSNSGLVALKLTVGLLIGSVSVISEAIHSGVDLLAAGIAWVAVRGAAKPADEEHPFGHGKMENVSGTVEALLIFLAAGWIVFEAVGKLLHPTPLASAGWGVAAMALSAGANLLVSRHLFRVGKETDSVALQADAWHLRTDVYASAGVLGGLVVIEGGRLAAPRLNLQWVDPVAAIGVALLILRAAYELTRESARDLLDVRLPTEEEAWLRDYLWGMVPAVRGFHRLRTRKAGADRFFEFRLLVKEDMSVDEAHRITEGVTHGIEDRFPGCSVTIHLEPCRCTCEEGCENECFLGAEFRQALRTRSEGDGA